MELQVGFHSEMPGEQLWMQKIVNFASLHQMKQYEDVSRVVEFVYLAVTWHV